MVWHQWAKTLTDENGNDLKCKVENGGDNRRQVHSSYKRKMPHDLGKSASTTKEWRCPILVWENPNTVHKSHGLIQKARYSYELIAAAHHNLEIQKGLSSIKVRSNVPSSVRQPPTNSQQSHYRRPAPQRMRMKKVTPSQTSTSTNWCEFSISLRDFNCPITASYRRLAWTPDSKIGLWHKYHEPPDDKVARKDATKMSRPGKQHMPTTLRDKITSGRIPKSYPIAPKWDA